VGVSEEKSQETRNVSIIQNAVGSIARGGRDDGAAEGKLVLKP